MNANIDYLGLLNLLRHVWEQGLITEKEARKIAARLRADLGADIVILS